MRLVVFTLPALFACSAPSSTPSTTAPSPARLDEAPAAADRVARPHGREAANVRVLVGGDVIPDRPRLATPEGLGDAIAPLAELFGGAQAVVVNHEAAVVPDLDHYDAIRSALVVSPKWTRELARGHVAAVTLSNNHACDAGEGGLDRTRDVVDQLGMIGIGADATDPFRARVIAAANGRRVCGVGWTATANAARSRCAASGKLAVAPFGKAGTDAIAKAVRTARANGCDAVIAIGHAGDEYEPQLDGARSQAVAAAEAGAAVVVLHHPHVPSGIETTTTSDGRRVPLFLSVGNLVSADRHHVPHNGWTRLGMMADLTFRWDDQATTPALVWGYHLVWTENEREASRSGGEASPRIFARPLDPSRDDAIVRGLRKDRVGPERLFDSACWLAVGPGCR
jgi:poly-gamma-glutamate synthesis protein (capsule biosynthesis protein)